MSVSTNSVKMNNMDTSNEAKEGNHMADKKVVFDTRELNLWYGEDQALKNINLEILQKMKLQPLLVHLVVENQRILKH